jgi:hypothetical protein
MVFLGSGLVARPEEGFREREIDAFFTTIRRPIGPDELGEEDASGIAQTGRLCLAYAGFIALLTFVPNPMLGRLKVLFCGALVGLVGWLLTRYGLRRQRQSRGKSA